MEAEQLRELQAPLKQRYRKDPSADDKPIELTERYCVVLQTIKQAPHITATRAVTTSEAM